MVVHLSWELQERGSGSTVSLTFGYSSLRRSTMATWEPEEPAPVPPALPLLACELFAELLCEVIFPFTELSKYETPSLHFAFTPLLSAIWWWKKSKRELVSLLASLPPADEPCTVCLWYCLVARALRHFSLLNLSAFPHPLALAGRFLSFSPLQSSFFPFPSTTRSSRSLRKIFRMTTEKWRLLAAAHCVSGFFSTPIITH